MSRSEKCRCASNPLLERFIEVFGGSRSGVVQSRAPGRVNLIGEHTDYNDGFVLPMAIDRDIKVVGRRRDDGIVKVFSVDHQQMNTFSVDNIQYDSTQKWSNYVRGVYDVLSKEGYSVVGAEMAIEGNVPQGAGLSSSAALEVAVLLFLQEIGGYDIDPVMSVKLAQRAENQFVGVNCGIMDQFISRLGSQGHALLLDCRDLSYRHIPFSDQMARIVVANSNVKRGLVDSEYNIRREQCQEGVAILSSVLPGVRALRDVTFEEFAQHRGKMPEVVARRCEHVIAENGRVIEGIAALEKGDLSRFGELMNASHASLRDLYEVSCPELNALVDIALEVEGVYGSRMMGGGFGGCTVNLVEPGKVEELTDRLEKEYPKRTGRTTAVFVFQPAAGASAETIDCC